MDTRYRIVRFWTFNNVTSFILSYVQFNYFFLFILIEFLFFVSLMFKRDVFDVSKV